MKLILKILKWLAIGVFLILVLLFSISQFMQDDVVNIFIKSINKNISTKIEVGSGSFSLISNFPKASVKLKDVLVHSSHKFDSFQFKKINTDTLLSAKSVSLEFKMTDLIKGIYNIESVSAEAGEMNLFSDNTGGVNYEILEESTSSSRKEFVINLEKINLSDIAISYINIATSINIKGLINSGRFKSRIAGNNIDLTANTTLQLSHMDAYPILLNTRTMTSMDLNLHKSDSGIFFRKGTFKIDNFSFGIAGVISEQNNANLKITGSNIDIAKIKKFLPAKYLEKFMEYNPAGILKIDCTLNGIIDRKNYPEIKINFGLQNGHVFYEKSNIKLNKLSYTGSFGNGLLKRPETSYIIINKAKATLGSADYTCSLTVKNFKNPKIDLVLSGEIVPSEILI
jgi:hypothetical protein